MRISQNLTPMRHNVVQWLLAADMREYRRGSVTVGVIFWHKNIVVGEMCWIGVSGRTRVFLYNILFSKLVIFQQFFRVQPLIPVNVWSQSFGYREMLGIRSTSFSQYLSTPGLSSVGGKYDTSKFRRMPNHENCPTDLCMVQGGESWSIPIALVNIFTDPKISFALVHCAWAKMNCVLDQRQSMTPPSIQFSP